MGLPDIARDSIYLSARSFTTKKQLGFLSIMMLKILRQYNYQSFSITVSMKQYSLSEYFVQKRIFCTAHLEIDLIIFSRISLGISKYNNNNIRKYVSTMLQTCYFIEAVHKRLLVTEILLSVFSGETQAPTMSNDSI